MPADIFEEAIKEIKKEREKIWLEKPEDIDLLRKQIGAGNQNFTIIMYANSDTQAMVKYLYNLLEMSKKSNMDLGTTIEVTIQLLEFDHRKMSVYYNLTKTSIMISMAIKAFKEIENFQEYQDLIQELLLFLGKINYWIDLEIPWKELAEVFEGK